MWLELDQIGRKKPAPAAVACRPLFLSDVLILIAAAGVALAWDRGRFIDPMRWISLPPTMLPRTLFPSTPSGWPWALVVYVVNGIEFLPPFLIMGSLAVFTIRMRSEWPVGRSLFRQPGATACGAASLALAGIVLLYLASYLSYFLTGSGSATFLWRRLNEDLMPEHLTAAATAIGYGVLGAWIALVAKRRWQPEPGWIDRLGRLLGAGWIAMILGGMILPIIHIASWGF